jgi:hypothetical protein
VESGHDQQQLITSWAAASDLQAPSDDQAATINPSSNYSPGSSELAWWAAAMEKAKLGGGSDLQTLESMALAEIDADEDHLQLADQELLLLLQGSMDPPSHHHHRHHNPRHLIPPDHVISVLPDTAAAGEGSSGGGGASLIRHSSSGDKDTPFNSIDQAMANSEAVDSDHREISCGISLVVQESGGYTGLRRGELMGDRGSIISSCSAPDADQVAA